MSQWESFPARILQRGAPLYRIHRSDVVAEYFSTSGTNRFDAPITSTDRYGVCYFGLTSLTAYVEVFGRIGTIQTQDIRSRRLSVAYSTADIRLADLTDRSILGRFGVTAAHSTSSDYTASQLLSEELHRVSFDGIVYRIRHDPSMELEAVALFGSRAGTSEPEIVSWQEPEPISRSLMTDGLDFGIRVLPAIELP